MSRKRRNVFWLASYPKSGNTWVRFILANLLYGPQRETRNVDHLVPNSPTPGPGGAAADRKVPDIFNPQMINVRDRNIIKTHYKWTPETPLAEHTAGAIYIIRHPLDVLVSNLNYLFLTSFDELEKRGAEARDAMHQTYLRDYLKSGGAPNWVQRGYGTWAEHVESWNKEDHGFPVVIVRYEDLKKNPVAEVRRMCEIIGISPNAAAINTAIDASSFDSLRGIEDREIEAQKNGFFYKPNFQSAHKAGLRFINQGQTGQAKTVLSADEYAAAKDVFGKAMGEYGYKAD